MCIKCELLGLISKYNTIRKSNFYLSGEEAPNLSIEFSIIAAKVDEKYFVHVTTDM